MYTLIHTQPWKRLLAEQLPALGGAFVVAEQFYKFHSFALECLAFLCTWYVFDVIQSRIRLAVSGRDS